MILPNWRSIILEFEVAGRIVGEASCRPGEI
jgi:hypothetical protein